MSSKPPAPSRVGIIGQKRERTASPPKASAHSPTPITGSRLPTDVTATEQRPVDMTVDEQSPFPPQNTRPALTLNLPAEEHRATHTIPTEMERLRRVSISSNQKRRLQAREARPSLSTPNPSTKVRPPRPGSPFLPSEELVVPHTLSVERSQQPAPVRGTSLSRGVGVEQHIPNPRSREHVERSSPPLDTRNTRSAPSPGASPSTRRPDPDRQESGESARAEVDSQTRQMVKATKELRKLNELFDCYSTSSIDTGDYNSRARQLRQRVMIRPDIIKEFERQLVHANYLIWNGAQVPSKFTSCAPYNEEIMEVLRTTPNLEERLATFKTMLHSLQQHSSSGHSRNAAREEKIRQLELVLQDVSIDLTILEHEQEGQGMEHEATSSTVSSSASASHANRVGSRSRRAHTPRTVHVMKPLEEFPSLPP
ncbi:hypothetical protein EPUS_01158 [Endocarpon pusillum Z07020]|uniref:Uncharacterized protein n=1 Tax=Endocarpon pusillum (strain Z07020 / HMAS-L-300199) TaxID=1263415 RepID=U1GBZ5_ENDPU|nr:uncharacterized protein EPUS_01158 [Endocarpon pusillum Z07020]ERF69201.1 hypothetical protein EPUS_01158 [Endocarpon pusillum Z07020]